MTTTRPLKIPGNYRVVEAYRLDKYDNIEEAVQETYPPWVVEAYRLDKYDNIWSNLRYISVQVVEAYRLDKYDNFILLETVNMKKAISTPLFWVLKWPYFI